VKKLINLIYIIPLLLLVASCSDIGIFYSLEHEKVILEKNNLNNSAAFLNMVDTNPGNLTGFYIGNGGPTIYYRSKADDFSPWAALELPGGFGADPTNTSMALAGTDLFISRKSENGTSIVSGVYRLDISSLSSVTPVSTDWVQVVSPTNNVLSYYVYKLHVANGNIYINQINMTRTPDQYATPVIGSSDLYYIATGSVGTFNNTNFNSTPVTFGSEGNEVISNIIYDATATEYWMMFNDSTNGNIVSSANADLTALTDRTTATIDSKLVDMFIYDPPTPTVAVEVLVSNQKGSIFYTKDTGTTWGTTAAKDGVQFNGFADINTLTANNVIVGTTAVTSSGTGYYLIDMLATSLTCVEPISDITNFNSNINNYNSSPLSDSSINGFLFDDSANRRLFAYTRNEGVWMNIDDNNEGIIWTLE
jgi:hypothetical protein